MAKIVCFYALDITCLGYFPFTVYPVRSILLEGQPSFTVGE